MKKAIIVGHSGQDGTYLSTLLKLNNYDIIGISIDTFFATQPSFSRKINIKNSKDVELLVSEYQPDEIYYLAAVHQSSADKPMPDGELFQQSIEVNLKSLVNFLESIRLYAKNTRLFYAASSHIFGDTETKMQDENTPFAPNCIYGITKTAGLNACRFYRNTHGIFVSIGIFYNHESPLRESKYVSKKIVEAAVAIKQNKKTELVLGNLESRIDWGYAPDYMLAVNRVLSLETPDDFIISSGEQHTVGEFVELVFSYLELDPSKYVKVDPNLITKVQKKNLFGSYQKLKEKTRWSPSVNFNSLVKILVDEELKKRTV